MIISIDDFWDFADSDGLHWLIISGETGIYYTAQCGGIACTHPEYEGHVIPLYIRSIPNDCDYGCQYLSEPENSADRKRLMDDFDKSLSLSYADCKFNLKADRKREPELMEGWIPVLLNGEFLCPQIDHVFKDHPCILITGNCD